MLIMTPMTSPSRKLRLSEPCATHSLHKRKKSGRSGRSGRSSRKGRREGSFRQA